LFSGGSDRVRTPPIIRLERADPPALFQARDGSVEGAGAETDARKTLDVFHHGVAVLFAIGEAGKYE
jgi:hypothetical protein